MIFSMTGFARQSNQGDFGRATWEIRCVNSRFLEINFKLPEIMRALEMPLRDKIKAHIKRGKIDCFLKFSSGETNSVSYEINFLLVRQLVDAANKIKPLLNSNSALDINDILRWPEVLQSQEANDDLAKQAILDLFELSLSELVAARQREGAELVRFIVEKTVKIKELVAILTTNLPLLVNEYRKKLLARIAEFGITVDAARIEQEIVIMAQKIDIAEELERLNTHLLEVQRHLKQGGCVGRHLDFLMQELNREANTIGSKCNDIASGQISVEIKVLIEQMREQIQNIE